MFLKYFIPFNIELDAVTPYFSAFRCCCCTALPYWRTEVEFMKDYKKMTDARLHSSFLVLLTGIEPITNP